MPGLPNASDFTGGLVTEDQQKTWITNLRTFLADLLGATGTIATALAQLGVIFSSATVAKSGAYTVIASDRGKTLNCTGTWSLSLTAAATLGDGFAVTVVNSGTGVITIDPSGSEAIDGATTLAVEAGGRLVLLCTGAVWLSLGRAPQIAYPISVANGGTGSGDTPTVSNSPQADNIKAVKHDHGANNIGSLVIVRHGTSGADVSAGTMYAGAAIRADGIYADNASPYTVKWDGGSALTGTWRALTSANVSLNMYAIFLAQRVA